MNILVYGSKGWIGTQFLEILKDKNIRFVCGEARVDDEDAVSHEIDLMEPSPSHVISFIGRTHGKIGDTTFTTIDYLEQPGKLMENVRDNLYSPLILAEICRQRGIHFTYLGTGCIFKYDENHPYEKEEDGFKEEEDPNFFGSGYSVVKGFTDRLMRNIYGKTALNLRIRMPITGNKHPRNFITKIVSYEKVCSIKNSMTVLPELLPVVVDMIEKKKTGTVNLTNPGLVSHNEILEMYKEIVDPSFTYQNFTEEDQSKILACERSNNFLETPTIQTEYPHVKNIKDSVRHCLESYARQQ